MQRFNRRRFFLTAAVASALAGMSEAADPTARELLRVLARPASATLSDADVVRSIHRTAERSGVPVWVDRRMDRSLRASVATGPTTTLGALRSIAYEAGFEAAPLDRLVYVGPLPDAVRINAIAETNRTGASRSLLRRARVRWPRLTTPSELCERVARESGLRIENPDAIPHDLLDTGETPSMRRADLLTLVLIGADLRWRMVEGGRDRLRIEPIGDRARWPADVAEDPAATDPPADPSRRRFTLRAEDRRLGTLLDQIARATSLRLDASAASESSLARRVSIDVREQTLQQLLAELGAANGLRITVQQGRLLVTPAGSDAATNR